MNLQQLVRQLELPPERLPILCRLLWDDPDQAASDTIDDERAALLGCGLLLYRYAGPEQAIWVLQRMRPHIDLSQPLVVQVLNQRLAVLGDNCWDLLTGEHHQPDSPLLRQIIESHALDVRALLHSIVESQARPAAGEALKQLLQAQRAAAADAPPAPASDAPSGADRPTED